MFSSIKKKIDSKVRYRENLDAYSSLEFIDIMADLFGPRLGTNRGEELLVKIAKYLEDGYDINFKPKNDNLSLLVRAVESGHFNVVKFLLENGAIINEISKPDCSNSTTTPLIKAAENDDPKIVKLLLDHGADVNFPNAAGMTALMYAAAYQHEKCSLLLIARGANVHLKDHKNQSVFDHAFSMVGRHCLKEGVELSFITVATLLQKGAVCTMGALRNAKEVDLGTELSVLMELNRIRQNINQNMSNLILTTRILSKAKFEKDGIFQYVPNEICKLILMSLAFELHKQIMADAKVSLRPYLDEKTLSKETSTLIDRFFDKTHRLEKTSKLRYIGEKKKAMGLAYGLSMFNQTPTPQIGFKVKKPGNGCRITR